MQAKYTITMCYLSDHIIPGTMGKTFLIGTDYADSDQVVLRVLSKIKGISKIQLNDKVYPHEITVCTDCLVTVKEVQEKAKDIGFHIIPRSSFLQSIFY